MTRPGDALQGRSLGKRLREGDRSAAPAALNMIEDRSPRGREQARALLAEAGTEPRSHLIGLTGPPGAGKSSLLSALLPIWRADGQSVAVLAVDPSSKVSGGSLLGDRVRIQHDPKDDGVLIRSTAAGARLGGLAEATRRGVARHAGGGGVVAAAAQGHRGATRGARRASQGA